MNRDAFLDQAEAATQDVHRRFHEHLRDLGWELPPIKTGDAEAALVNYVMGFPSCPHIGARQITALLFLKVLLCDDCTRMMLDKDSPNPMLNGPVSIVADDQCDLCWRRGIVIFTPTYWQIAFLIVRGDICDDCRGRFAKGTTIGTPAIDQMDQGFLK